MVTQPTKQIRIREVTAKRLEENKLIPAESYDSVINRAINEAEGKE